MTQIFAVLFFAVIAENEFDLKLVTNQKPNQPVTSGKKVMT